MRIISEKRIQEFATNNANARAPLAAWLDEVKAVTWSGPAEVRAQFRTASVLPRNRVVFNIGGNNYRMVCGIHYSGEVVYIRFIGTHAEYDKINAETV